MTSVSDPSSATSTTAPVQAVPSTSTLVAQGATLLGSSQSGAPAQDIQSIRRAVLGEVLPAVGTSTRMPSTGGKWLM